MQSACAKADRSRRFTDDCIMTTWDFEWLHSEDPGRNSPIPLD